jgi:hypothetical protein
MRLRFIFPQLLLGTILSSNPARSDTPGRFYCQLKALTPNQRRSHEQLTRRILAESLERRELADGFEFRVDSHTLSVVDLATWTQAEHLCCPFLRLAIDQEPEGGSLFLRLTGPKGTKDFLLEELHDLERRQGNAEPSKP